MSSLLNLDRSIRTVDPAGPTSEANPRQARPPEQRAYEFLLSQSAPPQLAELTLGLLHKYNNLITGVMFMLDDATSRADAAAAPRLEEIADALRSAHRFVDRVVRLHLGAEEDDTSYYELDALIEHELDLFALLLPKGSPIHYQPGPQQVYFYGSRHAVREILLHILANAGETIAPRGGAVWLEVSDSDPAPEGCPSCASVRIRDNGPGFSPEALSSLFTPLATTKPGHAGRGLFRSRQLARTLGGELTGRNHPEGGAELCLTLPQGQLQAPE